MNSSATFKTQARMKKLLVIVLALAGALCAVLCGILAYWRLSERVPTREEVDTLFQQIQSEQDHSQRVELAREILDSLHRALAYDAGPDIESYIYFRVERYFLEERDEAIFDAMDLAPMHAGFANLLSGLYADLKNEPEFISRYRDNETARNALRRCVGLAWSAEEYYAFVYSGDDSREIDEEIALEIARDAAYRLRTKLFKAHAVCEKADGTFAVTLFSESNPDQEEASVLIDSRSAKVIEVTDLRAD